MKRILKIVLAGLFFLLLSAGLAAYFFKNQLQKLVLHRLLAEIEATFGNYYQLQFSEIHTSLDFTNFSLHLIQPVFTTDTLQRAYVSRFPPVYFRADSVLVTGLNLRSLFFGKNIRLHEIALTNPSLVLLSPDNRRLDSSEFQSKYRRKRIQNISLLRFRITNGNLSLLNTHRLSDTVYYGEAIDLNIGRARLGLQESGPLSQQLQLKSLVFAMQKVVVRPIGTAYAFEMEKLLFDLEGDSIHGTNMSLLPDRSLFRLSKQAVYQKTFAKIALGDVALYGINYPALALKSLALRKVTLTNARFFLLRNKNKVTDPALFKKSIHKSLADLPIKIQIDSLLLREMQLEFQLYMPDKTQPAIVRLSQANGLITNLHNSDSSKHLTQFRLKSRIMAHGELDFQAIFTPNNPVHRFKGQIYTMPFSDWNQVIAQMAPVQISSGTIDGILFSGTANDMESRGKIDFQYHDLRASISRANKAGDMRKSSLLSGAAQLILRESNPPKGKNEAESHAFYFRREPWQGPVMLWVGGLLDGMEATLISEKNRIRLAEIKRKRKKPI